MAAVVKQHHVDNDISNRNMAEMTLVHGRIAWWRTSIIVVGLVVGLSSLLLFLAVLQRFIYLLELQHDIATCPSSDSRPPLQLSDLFDGRHRQIIVRQFARLGAVVDEHQHHQCFLLQDIIVSQSIDKQQRRMYCLCQTIGKGRDGKRRFGPLLHLPPAQ